MFAPDHFNDNYRAADLLSRQRFDVRKEPDHA
ncbi:hypothetical protein Vch1786_II0603 [Vibrio cholerae O1 str. 2010EL-1786]|uniref:Uncharacterized protein n=2 Tax=Vibrio cholerae TaxID=666 RepID=Q9KL31_VIBCH|nr:hypothetical protein VC_A0918 [Vibrio cholerae O1 biovar El Tor str. N16961]ACP07837.1 conserved hypothetical protein [Vibrio cholerae M66-2]ACP11774.1 conserved hypothetical protein [Vibrio cholerae O395]AET29021.1 hypothetical protein Vch1786_II0603 [Vibrio cholerae O1 str. 2010EL-1786]